MSYGDPELSRHAWELSEKIPTRAGSRASVTEHVEAAKAHEAAYAAFGNIKSRMADDHKKQAKVHRRFADARTSQGEPSSNEAKKRVVRNLFTKRALHPSSTSYTSPHIPPHLVATVSDMEKSGELYRGPDGLLRLSDFGRQTAKKTTLVETIVRAATAAYASTRKVGGSYHGDETLIEKMNHAIEVAREKGVSKSDIDAAHERGKGRGLSRALGI